MVERVTQFGQFLFELILGAFAELRKATISLVISVHLSTWNNSFPTGMIFVKSDIRSIFKSLSRKIQVSLKSGNTDGYVT
jgi:hypothetical protein